MLRTELRARRRRRVEPSTWWKFISLFWRCGSDESKDLSLNWVFGVFLDTELSYKFWLIRWRLIPWELGEAQDNGLLLDATWEKRGYILLITGLDDEAEALVTTFDVVEGGGTLRTNGGRGALMVKGEMLFGFLVSSRIFVIFLTSSLRIWFSE